MEYQATVEAPASQKTAFSQTEAPQKASTGWFNYDKYMFAVGIIGQSLFFWQFAKIIQNNSAGDVSLPGFAITLFSLVNWLIYGMVKKDKVLIFANIVGAFGAFLTVSSIIYVTYINSF